MEKKGITDAGPRLKAMNDALERDRLRLTDAEREAIEVAAEAYSADHGERFAATLRGLLERFAQFGIRESDRLQPIANCDSDRSQPIECTPATLSTPAKCTVPPQWTEDVGH